jgi:hypothetical protein
VSQPGGRSPDQARQLLEEMARQAPPPYLFSGISKLGEERVAARESLDAPMHQSLREVYQEFRRRVPHGRFNLWVGFQLHPQTFRPQEFIALDSQLCDKAFAGQSGPVPNQPG